ncbi:MAG TPA: NAD(P)/FAD-dependent oxidoreductase [Microthrixaceae bacterium]|nr:NAD(P)/FAD-dependent oxidoreductase [Microthrixaceae bacterium]
MSDKGTVSERHRVAIVGAGIGGLGLAHGLREDGIDDFVLLERSDGVGGTWRHNTYPGAACDVPSHLYSYSFAPNPRWSKVFADQPEILDYLERCADEWELRSHLRTGWKVAEAHWSQDDCCWTLRSATGETVVAAVVVFATGMFDEPRPVAIEGIDAFDGDTVHSARWDHSVELEGRRVGVVGTGASGVQIVPEVAKVAARTLVFQRTPPYVLPRRDPPYTAEEQARFESDAAELARVRDELYWAFEGTEAFRLGNPMAEVVKGIAIEHLERRIPDPALRAKLTPDYELGCNRTLISSDFYKAVVRDDVDLVTEPIARVRPEGVETVDGVVHDLDVLVLATGFRAGEYLHGIDVVGMHGEQLHERWAQHPHAYLGMTITGFPNMFVFYGPNTNQGGNSIILILEAQAIYVRGALDAMARDGLAALDVRRDSLDRYERELLEAMSGTVWATGCHSYFTDAGGRVVTQLPHTSRWYAERTATFDLDEYEVTPR